MRRRVGRVGGGAGAGPARRSSEASSRRSSAEGRTATTRGGRRRRSTGGSAPPRRPGSRRRPAPTLPAAAGRPPRRRRGRGGRSSVAASTPTAARTAGANNTPWSTSSRPRPCRSSLTVIDEHPDARGDVEDRRRRRPGRWRCVRWRRRRSPGDRARRRSPSATSPTSSRASTATSPGRWASGVPGHAVAPRRAIRPAAGDLGGSLPRARGGAGPLHVCAPAVPPGRCRPEPRKSAAPAPSRSSTPPLSSSSVVAAMAISAGCIETGLNHPARGRSPSSPRPRRRGARGPERKQVVGHPQLIEPESLGEPGQVDRFVDRDVVVHRAATSGGLRPPGPHRRPARWRSAVGAPLGATHTATTSRHQAERAGQRPHRRSHDGVDLDLDEEVVADQGVDEQRRVRRAHGPEQLSGRPPPESQSAWGTRKSRVRTTSSRKRAEGATAAA